MKTAVSLLFFLAVASCGDSKDRVAVGTAELSTPTSNRPRLGQPVPFEPGAWIETQRQPTANHLYSVQMVSDEVAFVLGRGETFLATHDRGRSWSNLVLSMGRAPAGFHFVSPQVGYAIDDSMKRTSDGGMTWNQVDLGSLTVTVGYGRLKALHFSTDGHVGHAVGAKGLIIRTSDGGASWRQIPTDVSADLLCVTVPSGSQFGLVGGTEGTVLRTNDGGQTWVPVKTGFPGRVTDVQVGAPGQSGFAVIQESSSSYFLLLSSDGGATWTRRPVGALGEVHGVEVAENSAIVLTVGDDGRIYRSQDLGGTWEEVAKGNPKEWPYDLEGVDMTTPGGIGLAVGESGVILLSEDGGASWTEIGSGTRLDLTSVEFAGARPQVGYVGGGSNPAIVLKAVDGGATWEFRELSADGQVEAIDFDENGAVGLAVGWEGRIWSTVDSGRSWSSRSSGTTAILTDVQLLTDMKTGYVVGDEGTILKTVDAGMSWASLDSGTSNYLLAVHFTEGGDVGYAAGMGGTILKTTDAGGHWARMDFPSDDDWIADLNFLESGQTGWAVGHGMIYRTDDGGQSWLTLRVGTNCLKAIHFSSPSVGFAVGCSPSVIKTEDGGGVWQEISGLRMGFGDVTSATPESVYLVGGSGTILRSR